jgi:monoamine oxidase
MFPIPLPWLIIGAMVALLGTYRGGYHFGWEDRDKDMQAEIAKKNEEARELEKNMASKLADKETALRKANNEISKKQSAMRELANTGRLRLPTASCPQASTSSTPATGDSRADASELERQTIATLIDIVAEGDKAIVKHTACVAAYNEMREMVNGKR